MPSAEQWRDAVTFMTSALTRQIKQAEEGMQQLAGPTSFYDRWLMWRSQSDTQVYTYIQYHTVCPVRHTGNSSITLYVQSDTQVPPVSYCMSSQTHRYLQYHTVCSVRHTGTSSIILYVQSDTQVPPVSHCMSSQTHTYLWGTICVKIV